MAFCQRVLQRAETNWYDFAESCPDRRIQADRKRKTRENSGLKNKRNNVRLSTEHLSAEPVQRWQYRALRSGKAPTETALEIIRGLMAWKRCSKAFDHERGAIDQINPTPIWWPFEAHVLSIEEVVEIKDKLGKRHNRAVPLLTFRDARVLREVAIAIAVDLQNQGIVGDKKMREVAQGIEHYMSRFGAENAEVFAGELGMSLRREDTFAKMLHDDSKRARADGAGVNFAYDLARRAFPPSSDSEDKKPVPKADVRQGGARNKRQSIKHLVDECRTDGVPTMKQ